MEGTRRLSAVDRQERINTTLNSCFDFSECRIFSRHLTCNRDTLFSKIVTNRVWQNEITVSQTLHERRSSEAIRTVIREIRFTTNKHARNRALQIIIYPEATHCIVNRRENHHRRLVWICTGDAAIHVKEITITLSNCWLAIACNRITEVEEYTETRRSDTATIVTGLLRSTRGNITWSQVTKAWVFTLQEVVARFLRNLTWIELTFANLFRSFLVLRSPDATVITERLRHQRQLRLLITVNWDTSWVNLRVARICETSTALMSTIRSSHITTLCICRKEEYVTITTGRHHNGIRSMTRHFTSDHVTNDHTLGMTVDFNHIEHFVAVIHLHLTEANLLT